MVSLLHLQEGVSVEVGRLGREDWRGVILFEGLNLYDLDLSLTQSFSTILFVFLFWLLPERMSWRIHWARLACHLPYLFHRY